MNVRNNALPAAMALVGLSLTSPALAQEADLEVSKNASSAKVGLGKTANTAIDIKNVGAVSATGVTLLLNTSAWPNDQIISAIDGCTPAVKGPKKNSEWFPCAITTADAPLKTETDLKPPEKTNALTVTITIQYGTALKKADVYNEDGSKKGTWTCPAADRFKPVVASVATTTTETNTVNNSVTVAAPQALWADLEVTLTGPDSVASSGGDYTFDFAVTNLGPCAVSTELAVDDSVTTGFKFVSATGVCRGLTDDFLEDGSDYQYCAVDNIGVGATVTGQKIYRSPTFPSDLVSSNQGTGLQITGGKYSDPNSANNASDVAYIVKAPAGCSSVGGGSSLALLGLSLAALFIRRAHTA